MTISAFKQAYRDQGYCVVPDLVPPEAISAALAGIRMVLRQQLGRFDLVETGDLEVDMARLLERDVDAYLASLRLGAKLAVVRRILSDVEIEKVCQTLGCRVPTISLDPLFHVMSERLQIPGGYFGFEAHQDWTSIQGALDAITIWLPLLPVTGTSFPLELIPGSHQRGLIEGQITPNLYHVASDQAPDHAFQPMELVPGDVVFMSVWTVHRTRIDGCHGLRMALSNRWEDASEPTFVARDYPCAYKKSVQREWITPDFPSRQAILQGLDRLYDPE